MKIDVKDRVLFKCYKGFIRLLSGTKGAGKSYVAAEDMIEKALCDSNVGILCFRKEYSASKMSCLPEIKMILEKKNIPYTMNETDGTITLCNGSMFIFRGLERLDGITIPDKESIFCLIGKNIGTINDTYVWLEEACEIYDDQFLKLYMVLSLRKQPEYWLNVKQITCTYNKCGGQPAWMECLLRSNDITAKEFNFSYLHNSALIKEDLETFDKICNKKREEYKKAKEEGDDIRCMLIKHTLENVFDSEVEESEEHNE